MMKNIELQTLPLVCRSGHRGLSMGLLCLKGMSWTMPGHPMEVITKMRRDDREHFLGLK